MPRSYGITNAAPWGAAPPVGPPGDTYYNTANSILYVSDGTSWNAVFPQYTRIRWTLAQSMVTVNAYYGTGNAPANPFFSSSTTAFGTTTGSGLSTYTALQLCLLSVTHSCEVTVATPGNGLVVAINGNGQGAINQSGGAAVRSWTATPVSQGGSVWRSTVSFTTLLLANETWTTSYRIGSTGATGYYNSEVVVIPLASLPIQLP